MDVPPGLDGCMVPSCMQLQAGKRLDTRVCERELGGAAAAAVAADNSSLCTHRTRGGIVDLQAVAPAITGEYDHAVQSVRGVDAVPVIGLWGSSGEMLCMRDQARQPLARDSGKFISHQQACAHSNQDLISSTEGLQLTMYSLVRILMWSGAESDRVMHHSVPNEAFRGCSCAGAGWPCAAASCFKAACAPLMALPEA